MNECFARLDGFFAAEIEGCRQREKVLTADERRDEAVFEKIRANVYDIFRTVLSVAVNKYAAQPEKAMEFFEVKLSQIPAGWKQAYAQALEHNDAVRAETERIKTEAAEAIRRRFDELREAKQ